MAGFLDVRRMAICHSARGNPACGVRHPARGHPARGVRHPARGVRWCGVLILGRPFRMFLGRWVSVLNKNLSDYFSIQDCSVPQVMKSMGP